MAIIFDLDGTLINSFDIHIRLMKKSIDEIIGKDVIPLYLIKSYIRFPSKQMLSTLSKQLKIKITPVQMKNIIELKDKMFDKTQIRKIKFYPKAKDLLLLLKNKNAKFCIATSMNTEELGKVEPWIKLKGFCEIINSPALKHEKPDPYILKKAIKSLNSKKSETFYVGDAETDYEASKNAGIKFIGVNNPKLVDLGDMYFKDVKTLYTFIKTNYFDFL
jgi:HAD superfamily hydrolase (TIGR01549 family)